MANNKSSVDVKKALQNIKVKVESTEIFQKMIDQGSGLTFTDEGMPLIYKQLKNNRHI